MSSRKNGPKNKKNRRPAKTKKRPAGSPKRGGPKARKPQQQATRRVSATAPSKAQAQAPARDRVRAWRRATMVLAVLVAGLVGDRVQHASSAADLQRMKDVGTLIREAVTTAVGGASLAETLTKRRRPR